MGLKNITTMVIILGVFGISLTQLKDLLRNTMTPPIYDYNVESLLLELKLKPLQD
jgi:hypothetical protein